MIAHDAMSDRKGRLGRPFLYACTAAALLGCGTPVAQERMRMAEPPSRSQDRLRPPPLACDRNHLTSWRGLVSGYRRGAHETWLQISTDDDTVESTTLVHADAADAAAFYRLDGRPFTAADWGAIDSAPGTLRAGMRATAWICEDGVTPPVIDWQPPTAG